MTLIDQLEETVTPAVLGTNISVAHISLLEQFYAILVSRLASSEIYTQLLQEGQNHSDAATASHVLLEQLWQQPSQRQLLIQELSANHHIDEAVTKKLLISAAHLSYQELKNLAKGQYLPAFLQGHQSEVRQYLPVWSTAVISPVVAVLDKEPPVAGSAAADAALYDNHQLPNTARAAEQALAADTVPVIVDTTEPTLDHTSLASDAIHANPSAHHIPEGLSEVRRRNRRNDLIVRALLLAGALVAIAAVWALFFKEEPVEPVAPVVVAPVVAAPEVVAEPPEVLIPAGLSVAVDDSGNLYSCTATVGDIALQGALTQALNTSFGEQVNLCNIRVQEGIAKTLTALNIEALPQALTLMRAVPFSRFYLQNNAITLEAPDAMLLQQLLDNMRTALPTVTIMPAAPITVAQPPANTYDETYNNGNYNNDNNLNGNNYNNNAMPNNTSAPITTDNNVITNQPAQNPNINPNNDNEAPAAPPRNFNNNNNLQPSNQTNIPANGMSPEEADAIANSVIMAEPAQINRPNQ